MLYTSLKTKAKNDPKKKTRPNLPHKTPSSHSWNHVSFQPHLFPVFQDIMFKTLRFET